MEVLALSTARNILNPHSRDRERMRLYAEKLSNFHIVLLTQNTGEKNGEIHEGSLHVYPTNSKSKMKMLIDSYFLGRRIVKAQRRKIVVTAQDPLWTGWVSWLLSFSKNTLFHVQVHGDYFSPYWAKGSIRRRLVKPSILFLLRHAEGIRVVSHRIKKSFISRDIEEKKITVLPIRPELETFFSHQRIGTIESPFTFLYVGRFAPEKNLMRLMRAFSLAYKERKDIRLQLAGEGEMEQEIKNFVSKYDLEDVVSITGWVENIAEVMQKADVFVLPSKHEAYGLVLLEAMAVGLPVVSTDVGCVGEVVKDGVHGVIVKDESDTALAQSLIAIIKEPKQILTYSNNCKETAKSIAETSMDTYIEAWVNVLPSR